MAKPDLGLHDKICKYSKSSSVIVTTTPTLGLDVGRRQTQLVPTSKTHAADPILPPPAHAPAGSHTSQRHAQQPAAVCDVTRNVNNTLSLTSDSNGETEDKCSLLTQPDSAQVQLVIPETSHGQVSLEAMDTLDYNAPALSVINSETPKISEATDTAPLGPDPAVFASCKKAYWPTLVPTQWKDHPQYAMLYSATSGTGLPNHMGARITVPSGLKLANWEADLKNYHDHDLCKYLRFGWPVGYTASHPPTHTTKNHKSAEQHPQHVQAFIVKELALGGLLGPFSAPPFQPWTNQAPLMTRPKKASQARRIILDLSYPPGEGVNAGITRNVLDGKSCVYTLPTIEDLVTRIQILGPRSYIWKADLARAYRQLRTDPADLPLLGLYFQGSYYLDTCPSFGARLSASACQRVTSAVTYLLRTDNNWVMAYLDDFCGAEKSHSAAMTTYTALLDKCNRLGLDLAPDKCEPPARQMEWLGFKLDTCAMSLTIPDAKLSEILQECKGWSRTYTATRKRIQSLAGKLVHISKCIRPARKFICRILDTLRRAPEVGVVRVNMQFKQDVTWFLNFARETNGIHLISPTQATFSLECDSSLVAGGGVSNKEYYSLVYTDEHKKAYHNSTLLEATNIVTAYRTLAPTTPGLAVTVYTDNITSKYALETGRTHNSVLAACARQMWVEAALRDHTIKIVHRPGVELDLADALSRPHMPHRKARADKLVKERSLTCVTAATPHPMFSCV